MTQVETKVFEPQTLGRRILRKKFLGKIPALPLLTLLVVASFAAAAIYVLGPTTSAPITLASMTSAGLPTGDFAYANTTGVQNYVNITVSANSYTAWHSAYVVLTATAPSLISVPVCESSLTVMLSNNVTGGGNLYTTLIPTQSGTTCTYTGSALTQRVNALKTGAAAPNYPFAIKYVNFVGTSVTWTSQFWGT